MKILRILTAMTGGFTVTLGYAQGTTDPVVQEIVEKCYYKNQGADQKTRLAISIKSTDGKVNTSEYIRLWKAVPGQEELEEKMALFTLTPPENKGIAYMRWGYRPNVTKPPEQWVYLPELKKVRRVSQRDPSDMTWGLTDEDFRVRLMDEDSHALVETKKDGLKTTYIVESKPKVASAYSRWVTEYIAPDGAWFSCNRSKVRYFDKSNRLLKDVTYNWSEVDNVWVWREVIIENSHDLSIVSYRNSDVKVNVGLTDDTFTERQLRRGPP